MQNRTDQREMPEGILEMPDNLDIDPELKEYLEMMARWHEESAKCNFMWD